MSYTLPHAQDLIRAGIKIHTMRDDPKDNWRAGRLIHHCTGLRSANYNCFKIDTCVSTQRVLMVLAFHKAKKGVPAGWQLHITVDRHRLSTDEISLLIRNDGFNSYTDFRNWFFPLTAKGIYRKTMRVVKLIHWTQFMYTKKAIG